jgi:hypothetical protein
MSNFYTRRGGIFMSDGIKRVLNLFRGLPFYPGLQTKIKYGLSSIVLSVLGPAFEVISKMVPEIKTELASWEDGRRFAVGILPKGPYITLEKKGDMIYYIGKGLICPNISMFFKNFDAALPVFLGIKGSFQTFAENGMLVEGNLAHTMEVNRVANIIYTYLFPGIILKIILKRPPKLNVLQLVTKSRVYMALTPAIVLGLVKK